MFVIYPIIALILLTPEDELSSFIILNPLSSPVLEAYGPPHISFLLYARQNVLVTSSVSALSEVEYAYTLTL